MRHKYIIDSDISCVVLEHFEDMADQNLFADIIDFAASDAIDFA